MIFDVPFMNLIIVLNKEMNQCIEMFVINNMKPVIFSSKNGQPWKFLTNIISNRKTYKFSRKVKKQKAAGRGRCVCVWSLNMSCKNEAEKSFLFYFFFFKMERRGLRVST